MDFTKICIACDIEKVCSDDPASSEFGPRKITSKNQGFDNTCKRCCAEATKRAKKNKSKISKLTGGSGCITLGSMIDEITGNIHKNHQDMDAETIKNLANQLIELANQKEIENRTTPAKSMFFSKKDIGFKPSSDALIKKIMVDLSMESNKFMPGGAFIMPEDVHVFQRKDKIKIIIESNEDINNDQKLMIKTIVTNTLSGL
jgi:hypothetical protein